VHVPRATLNGSFPLRFPAPAAGSYGTLSLSETALSSEDDLEALLETLADNSTKRDVILLGHPVGAYISSFLGYRRGRRFPSAHPTKLSLTRLPFPSTESVHALGPAGPSPERGVSRCLAPIPSNIGLVYTPFFCRQDPQ
jgi:hypothetical protein